MALLDVPDLYGNAVFCDDIRTEIDGKSSLIGVYTNQMFVHGDFPVTLPKFAFSITFVQKKKIFDPNVGIRIFLPQDPDDAPSIQADMGEHSEGAVLANIPRPNFPMPPESDQAVVALRANLIFAPLVIAQPGAIKVRIARRGDLVRLGGLYVSKAPQTT